MLRSGLACNGADAGNYDYDAPPFERYDENFDPLTGNGRLEIWVPVKD